MKKLICMIMACAAGMFLLSGCAGKPLCTDTDSGVTIELYNMRYEQKGVHLAIPEVTIRNRSGEPITAVFWRTVFYDRDGNELGEKLMFWQAEKEALADGADLEDNASRYVIDMKETPASFTAELKEIRTEAEYPLDKIPEEGEYLFEALGYPHLADIGSHPPVKIVCGIDNSGWLRTATFEGDDLQEAVDAFMKIKVGAGDAPMVTDNYNWFQFEWEDGSTEGIRLNLNYLEVSANGRYYSYYLENLEPFWRMIHENLVDPADNEPLHAYGTNSSLNMELDEITFDPSDKEDVLTMHGHLTIENASKNDLLKACAEVTFINEDDIAYAHKVYFFEADDLPTAGETKEMMIEADLPERTDPAKRVRLDVLTVMTEKSVKNNQPLAEGEYLYKALGIDAMANMEEELPLMVEVHIDRMGAGYDYLFVEDEIAEAVETFIKVMVGPDGAPVVTDNYNHITFLFEDGTECMLRFNLYALEYYDKDGTQHSYAVPGIEKLFELAEAKR